MCPHCGEPLIIVELEGVEVDYCLACHGVWFDTGELDLVIELAGGDPSELAETLHPTGRRHTPTRRCPRCSRRMRIGVIGQTETVEVDCCPDGHGIWLDANELAAIVKLLTRTEDAAVAAFCGDLFRHDLTGNAEDDE